MSRRRFRFPLIVIAIALPGFGYFILNRGPYDRLLPIVCEYHPCDQCGSFEGRIDGNRTIQRLRTSDSLNCIRTGKLLSRGQFKNEGRDQFQIVWIRDAQFWFTDWPITGQFMRKTVASSQCDDSCNF